MTGSEAEPEFLLSSVRCEAHPSSPETEEATVTSSTVDQAQVDQETQARLEALLEAAGISRLSGESRQLADPEILRRLTSSVR